MHGLATGALSGLDQRRDVAVRQVRRSRAEQHRLVGLVNVPASAVGLGVHGDGLHAHRAHRPDDASRRLTSVGHQDDSYTVRTLEGRRSCARHLVPRRATRTPGRGAARNPGRTGKGRSSGGSGPALLARAVSGRCGNACGSARTHAPGGFPLAKKLSRLDSIFVTPGGRSYSGAVRDCDGAGRSAPAAATPNESSRTEAPDGEEEAQASRPGKEQGQPRQAPQHLIDRRHGVSS